MTVATLHVPLALDHGISTMISLDNLATDWWLKGVQLGGSNSNNLSNLSDSRFTITHTPTTPHLQLDNTYTILRPKLQIMLNKLLAKHFQYHGGWTGDLLIVKHQGLDLDQITNICDEDEQIIDTIIN